MEQTLLQKGAVLKDSYSCKGKTFALINRDYPTEKELIKAKNFARDVIMKNL